MKNGARLDETTAVAPVVETFARYEVTPVEKPGVGRYAGRLARTPALRFLIAKPGDELDDQVRDKLEQLVCAAVACGYANTVNMESSAGEDFKPRTTPDLEPLWAFWITHLYGDDFLKEAGFDRSAHLAPIREQGDVALSSGLKALGLLPRLRRRTRISVLGMTYGQAGATLRAAQCEAVLSDDRMHSDQLAQTTNLWPLRSGPPSPRSG